MAYKKTMVLWIQLLLCLCWLEFIMRIICKLGPQDTHKLYTKWSHKKKKRLHVSTFVSSWSVTRRGAGTAVLLEQKRRKNRKQCSQKWYFNYDIELRWIKSLNKFLNVTSTLSINSTSFYSLTLSIRFEYRNNCVIKGRRLSIIYKEKNYNDTRQFYAFLKPQGASFA